MSWRVARSQELNLQRIFGSITAYFICVAQLLGDNGLQLSLSCDHINILTHFQNATHSGLS